MRQLRLHWPRLGSHIHSLSPSQSYWFVQRHLQSFAQTTAAERQTHMCAYWQSLLELSVQQFCVHVGPMSASHLQRASPSHVDWVMYKSSHLSKQLVPFHKQLDGSFLQKDAVSLSVAFGIFS